MLRSLPDDSPDYILDAADAHLFAKQLNSMQNEDSELVQVAIRQLLVVAGLDLMGTDWLKKVAPELWEFRIGKTSTAVFSKIGLAPPEGFRPRRILVRVFCSFQNGRIILLLSIYDKGRDPTAKRQRREIEKASRLLVDWKQENR